MHYIYALTKDLSPIEVFSYENAAISYDDLGALLCIIAFIILAINKKSKITEPSKLNK